MQVIDKIISNFTKINSSEYKIFIFTSSNAIRNIDTKDFDKKSLCFCVGDATEKTAKQKGFHNTFSALLQIFYFYNNSFYPRDTKDQIKYTKKNSKKRLFKKGDIIFWKGHVAMCLNSKQLIHAYGPERKVIIMPIIETINRIEKTAKLKVKKVSRIKY